MGNMQITKKAVLGGILLAVILFSSAGRLFAHCDTTDGPIIPEAKAAIEKAEVTPLLKWVKPENEGAIKAAFAKTITVRSKGPEAKALADQYFLETLVRLHREGEGAPYTGIKNEPVEPIVAMADKALVDGSADTMIKEISEHMAAMIREKFNAVIEAQKGKDKDTTVGRKFVDAYVIYMHYVEGVHNAILSAGGHQHAGKAKNTAASPKDHHSHKK